MANSVGAMVRLLRPHQWLKNGFVLVGLLFGHAWNDPAKVQAVLLAVLAFCLVSSAIYVVNDLTDREADRLHPKKRHRPLAAGTVSVRAGVVLGLLCAAGGFAFAYLSTPRVVQLVAAYALLNLVYSWHLKHVVILDVFMLAAFFMLRLLAGTQGIGIPPSSWLLLTGMMVTLFLGFAKRRSELAAVVGGGEAARRVLHNYSLPMLDLMIGVCATGVVMAYSLYTMSADTIAVHHTAKLIYTVPIVLYGLFRYLYLTFTTDAGEDPARDLLRDPHLWGTVVAWGGLTLWLLR